MAAEHRRTPPALGTLVGMRNGARVTMPSLGHDPAGGGGGSGAPAPAAAEGAPAASAAQRLNAERALLAYTAMQAHFYADDGSSLYYEHPRGQGAQAYAALFPFSRALAATQDLEGVSSSLLPGFSAHSAMVDREAGLERFWDVRASPPAYDSRALPPQGQGGDKYYDDNAWVGLAFVEHYRLRGQASSRERAEQLFEFALTGWDTDTQHPYPGGVFWVQQGTGRGLTEHQRNAAANAANAELGFQLHELTGNAAFDGQDAHVGARNMYDWVDSALDASKDTSEASTGLFYDHVNLKGEITKALWTYNQGTMVGANVLLHRLAGGSDSKYIALAEAIAKKALAHFSAQYFNQPEQFNAIFFRNLLLLYAASSNATLKKDILAAISGYAEEAWQNHRDSNNLFPKNEPTLIKHAAMVQIFAVLAWETAHYERL